MKRVLAILGDYYHDIELLKEALHTPIMMQGNKIEMEYILVGELVEKLKERPNAVILSKMNSLNPGEINSKKWMDETVEKEICQYVKEGGGWFVWHSGLSSYENHVDYYSMVRGKFDYHPSEHKMVTYKPTNYSSQFQSKSFEILDEHYFVTCDEQSTNVFLRAISTEGNSIAGWFHEYGEGRVVCLTPAHSREGLLHEGTTAQISQSLKWCCRLL